MLKKDLLNRNLPPLKSREEMVEIMQREVYGYLPKNDFELSVDNYKIIDGRFDKGNVVFSSVELTLSNTRGSHTFPVQQLIHQDGKKHPVIICINFPKQFPAIYVPIEELTDSEYDIFNFCYTDVTNDDDDQEFATGLAPLIFPDGRKNATDCGKIGIWGFSAMRVLDYVLTLEGTDPENIGLLGHSRLGKTALFTGMLDERFSFILSNNAGCGGEAIARGGSGLPDKNGNFLVEKQYRGETIADITSKPISCWFCENYKKYAKQNYSDDFDQHYVLASIAPRNICINAAELDYWADQKSVQLCCMAASEAWETLGLDGFEECDHYITPDEALFKGNIGLFMAPTEHSLSRYAWNKFMEFMRIHRK